MHHDRPTRASIDLAALRANFAEAQRLAGRRDVIAVVKADAYGHGALPVARNLVAAGCRRLAVVSVEEGMALRDAQIDVPILLLGGVHGAAGAEAAVAGELTGVIQHAGQLELLSAAARACGTPARVHVEVDTGMRRMGVPPEGAVALLERVAAESGVALDGVYTHLARGDEPELGPSLEQLATFRRVLADARARGVEYGLVHAVHSAGLLAGKRLCEALPEAGAVRPGLMLYGVSPAPHLSGQAALTPVMTFRTRVAQLRDVARGEAVGYAATYCAPRATRIATLPVGYADGVPIAASNRGVVQIAGRAAPIVGRVSMDFITVDVGDAAVALGDEAILFGKTASGAPTDAAHSVERAAAAADTIAYELLVRVGARVPRAFEGNSAP